MEGRLGLLYYLHAQLPLSLGPPCTASSQAQQAFRGKPGIVTDTDTFTPDILPATPHIAGRFQVFTFKCAPMLLIRFVRSPICLSSWKEVVAESPVANSAPTSLPRAAIPSCCVISFISFSRWATSSLWQQNHKSRGGIDFA